MAPTRAEKREAEKKSKEEKEAAELKAKQDEIKRILMLPKLSKRQTALKLCRADVARLALGVATKESRLVVRVSRVLNERRRRLTLPVLRELLQQYEMTDVLDRDCAGLVDEVVTCAPKPPPLDAMDIVVTQTKKEEEEKAAAAAAEAAKYDDVYDNPDNDVDVSGGDGSGVVGADGKLIPKTASLPEVQTYLHVLTLMYVTDVAAKLAAETAAKKKPTKPEVAAVTTARVRCVSCADALLAALSAHNRRSLDSLSAKAYQYWALAHRRVDMGVLSAASASAASASQAALRPKLLALYRTVTLRRDEPGQAVLSNALMDDYVSHRLYAQADAFRLNTTYPASSTRSNAQLARHLYYCGRVDAVQLQYGEACDRLAEALRKGPRHGAVGFRQQCSKLHIIVQLLIGECPDRSTFRHADLARALQPYLELTQAVRVGDVGAFSAVVERHLASFTRDGNISLINRLRHNVIKTGLRKINTSYSRISLSDICTKLGFESEQDAANVVAKAIHDGVIDAVVNHDEKYVFSRQNLDVYTTTTPHDAFHRRVDFCVQIHNDAVLSLRFPEKNDVGDDDDDDDEAKQKKEGETKTEEDEIDSETALDDEDMTDDGGD